MACYICCADADLRRHDVVRCRCGCLRKNHGHAVQMEPRSVRGGGRSGDRGPRPDGFTRSLARRISRLPEKTRSGAAESRKPADWSVAAIFCRRIWLARNGGGNGARLQIALARRTGADGDFRKQLRRSGRNRFLRPATRFTEIDLQSSKLLALGAARLRR